MVAKDSVYRGMSDMRGHTGRHGRGELRHQTERSRTRPKTKVGERRKPEQVA